ncbi:MAG: hypothetical protein Q9170_002250 [Blastenia crenularia]
MENEEVTDSLAANLSPSGHDKFRRESNHTNGSSTNSDHHDRKQYFTEEGKSTTRNTKRKGKRKPERLTLNLLTLLAMTHVFPRARQHTRKFYHLAYYNSSSGKYAIGWDDSFLVINWVVVFCGLRAFVMDYVLMPLAQVMGLEKKKDKTRFAEQAWVLIYDTVFWSLGMYLMYHSNYWLDARQMWAGWPDREMGGLFKWYYLVQFAFWIQQIVIVNIEERRKDHWQMFSHHIITCFLMFASYAYHQTRVGNTILCLMDVVDLLLPLAKLLKYLRFRRACDVAFGAFMLVWIGARHVLFLRVCYSLYAEMPQEIAYGCYRGSNANLQGPLEVPNDFGHLLQPFRDPEGLVLLIIWFGMIVRVALKVLKGGEAEDSRSDDEASDEEGGNKIDNRWESVRTCMNARPVELPPLEEVVGVEGINLVPSLKTSPSRRYKKMGGAASGVHIPADSKELLGRIGCDNLVG